jgi:hypothetical protein
VQFVEEALALGVEGQARGGAGQRRADREGRRVGGGGGRQGGGIEGLVVRHGGFRKAVRRAGC